MVCLVLVMQSVDYTLTLRMDSAGLEPASRALGPLVNMFPFWCYPRFTKSDLLTVNVISVDKHVPAMLTAQKTTLRSRTGVSPYEGVSCH